MKTKEELKQYLSDVGFDCNHFNPNQDPIQEYKIGGIYLQQHMDEYVDMINFLLLQNPPIKTFLEVGAASGGNTYVLSNILNLEKVIIIDDNSHHHHSKRKDILKDIQYEEYICDSQSEEAKKYVNDLDIQFDFIYIDANHSFNSVKNDYFNYKDFVKIGGLLGFHDAGIKGLPQLFEEVVSKDNSFEMIFDVFHRFGNRIYRRIK